MPIRVLSRDDWGADPAFPRRGYTIGPSHRTEVIIHHTAIHNAANRSNEWSSIRDVRREMQRLQTLRAEDLGADVPYNFVAFCMTNGDLILAEGRGLYRTGAHTSNHNRSGIGIAWHGNFETYAVPPGLQINFGDLGDWLRAVRLDEFVNLGSTRPESRHVFAHREYRATLCPGTRIMPHLPLIYFIDQEEQMDTSTWKLVQQALQQLSPPLYAGQPVDGKPGRNTHIAVRAFERRKGLVERGVMGPVGSSSSGMWPATRELLFVETRS